MERTNRSVHILRHKIIRAEKILANKNYMRRKPTEAENLRADINKWKEELNTLKPVKRYEK